MTLPTPRRLYMLVATAEAVTWTLLLIGMFLKYVTKTTELGVRIGGMLHGIVFIAYVLVTIIVWVDRKWPAKQGLVALASAIPPLLTLWTERWLDRDGHLPRTWRLLAKGEAVTFPEKVVSGALRRPALAALALVVAVAVLTGVALLVGPPVG
ncbi:hypothetical protein ASG73_04195 [Janibacter sp. Soil728]|uniref:DUF3817 domain-containing protein n=1 Tax=Janibacter sp. Soil728 TaxID=1736393 RepID=UPI0006F7AA06|nr:DUF3817 domain-containing protein [Janibacter sp. Soil728]KRE39638.1 hypothetical protein ASG73_04195 [Janibacter sp. Soil728]